MKNIHVLPTDKPSELYINMQGVLSKSNSLLLRLKSRHIYITSSDEEIKEGDWVIQVNFEKTNTQLIQCATEFQVKIANDKDGSFTKKKIILTTDQDLIKDGVQGIDDDFLEWYVKNPSCEEVEVEIESKFDRVDGHYHDVWEIIIPKEEPKQEYKDKEFQQNLVNKLRSGELTYENASIYTVILDLVQGNGKEEVLRVFNEVIMEETKQELPIVNGSYGCTIQTKKQEPKQETLEEASKKYALNRKFNMTSHLIGFRKGAKWQAERMYSEEEVIEILIEYDYSKINDDKLNSVGMIKKWFEQFKKK